MNAKHPLGAMIEQAKSANDWSDVDVSKRASDRGHEISKSNIARIRNGPVSTIVGKQLFALSAGLGIPVQALAMAAMQSMGVPGFSASHTDAEQAIRLDPTIPEYLRRTLLTIIRDERIRQGGAHNEKLAQQEPGTQASSTEHRSASSSARGTGAPMTAVKTDDSTDGNQGVRADDVTLAARRGESEHDRRQRLEVQPEDEPQGEGPEGGA